MISVKLPVNDESYSIDAPSIVENHIMDKFSPFVNYEKDKNARLFIKVDKKQIIIDNKKEIYYISTANYFDTYKTLINIIRENTIATKNVNILHGASVNCNNHCIIFLGESGAGKSTLSAYLGSKPEFKIGSDDLIFVNYDTNNVIDSSKFLYLRSSSLRFFSNPKGMIYDKFINRYKIKLAVNEKSMLINDIYILSREINKECRCEPAKDPIKEIINSMYLPYSIKANIHTAVMLSCKNSVNILHYNELNSVYDFLIKKYVFYKSI